MNFYQQKETAYGPEIMRQLERYAVLSTIDRHWRDHLAEMDELRTGIGLRAYHGGMGKPIDIYKREAFKMFEEMIVEIDREIVNLVYKLQVNIPERSRQTRREPSMVATHADSTNMGMALRRNRRVCRRICRCGSQSDGGGIASRRPGGADCATKHAESREKRSLSMRKREKIQKMSRRR